MTGSVTDDRGASRGVIPLHDLRRDPRTADARFRVVIDRVRGQVISELRAVLIGLAMGFVGPAALLAARWLSMPPWVTLIPAVAIAAGIGRLLYMRAERRGRAASVTVLLNDGLCPTCAYSFAGLGPGADGCYECPECGAAWRASRVIRRTVFHEQPGEGFAAPDAWWRRVGMNVGLRRLKDDRGIEGPAADARLRESLAATTDPQRRERLLGVRRAAVAEGRVARFGLALFYAVVGGLQIWNVLLAPARAKSPLGILAMVGGVILFGVAAMFLRSNVGISKRTLRREMLRRALCPRCAADLDGSRPSDDGCTVCRECGAAWRTEEVNPVPTPAT